MFGLLPCGGFIWTRVAAIVVVAISGDTIGEVLTVFHLGWGQVATGLPGKLIVLKLLGMLVWGSFLSNVVLRWVAG
jgi:hypothetical protein